MSRDDDMHQIGEAAKAVGLSLRTLRHYEEVGLVSPSGRTQGGFRLYTDDDIGRLRLIKHMKPLDFSLDEMRQLLETRDELLRDDVAEVEHAQLSARLRTFAAAADERCARLRDQLRAAEGFADALRQEVDRPRQREIVSRR